MINRTTERPDLAPGISLLFIVIILLLTFFVFANDLAHTPPEVPSDATHNLGEGLRISRGIPFPADFGQAPEPVFRYLVGGWFALVGPYVFTARLVPVFLSLLTVALTYQAGLQLLHDWAWRRLGALVAALAVAACVPFLILGRDLYRAALLSPVVVTTAILMMVACRSTRAWRWVPAGFAAGMAMLVHLAGLMSPPWAVGLVIHQLVVAPRRLQWRKVPFFLAGLAVPVAGWLTLWLLIPNWLARADVVGMVQPFSAQALAGLWGATQAYIRVGYLLPTFNTPNTPFLNPPLAILAVIGLVASFRYWRRAEAALLYGGMFLFSLPGALTSEPTYPIRLIGTTTLLGLLAGWGAVCVIAIGTRLWKWRKLPTTRVRLQPVALTVISILTIFSLGGSHLAYHGMFDNPANYADPRNWLSIPHNFSMAFQESMQLLANVDRPTYVPMWLLDNPAAAFFLQRQAFPNVTTWARYGLKELPAGQFFMPGYWYYHMTAEDTSIARVLLIPADKTIVLLPGSGLSPEVAGPPPAAGDPGVTEIKNERGWVLARIRPVPRADFKPDYPPSIAPGEPAPAFSNGLQLLTRQPVVNVEPGKPATVLLEWLVTAPQPADVFSVVQLIKSDFSAVPGNSDHHVLFYLYPSAMWKPGDIVPDWHTVTLPANMPAGLYRWGAGMYVSPRHTRYPVAPPPGDYGPQLSDLWMWDAVRLPNPNPNPTIPPGITTVQASLGDQISLEGFQVQRKETQWTVTVYWRAKAHPGGDYIVFLHAQRDGKIIGQRDEKPLGGQLPTWAWQPGEVVATSYDIPLDQGLTPDSLYIGMYSFPSLTRLPVLQDGVPQPDSRALLWKAQ